MHDINLTLNIFTVLFLFITLLAIGVCCFLIGYLYGRKYTPMHGVYNITNKKQSNNISAYQPISINESKVVTDIKTDGMEKKYDSLGDIQESKEKIDLSINKLKHLKR